MSEAGEERRARAVLGSPGAAPPLAVRVTMRGPTPRVVVSGELVGEGEAAAQLRACLDGLAGRSAARVELDLTAVARVDPAGVRWLVGLRRRYGAQRLAILPGSAVATTIRFVAAGERNRREDG